MSSASFAADYSGRVVLVTGAASGISRATAFAFAAAGANVLVVDRNGEGAAATAASIREREVQAEPYTVDVTSAAQIDTLVHDAVSRFGRIDCAFNGAGVGSPIGGTIAEYEEEHWDYVLNINLRGIFLCVRAEVRQMLAQGGGVIVNVASTGGMRATPKSPAYTTSKHGVIGLTRAVALDHAKQNIRINAICPGLIGGTPMMDNFVAIDPVVRTAHLQNSVPLGRLGKVDEIAATALWLCSDAASFVTGTTIAVDGGFMAG